MLQRMSARFHGDGSRTPTPQCNHREAESLTVVNHGRIQSCSSDHQRPSSRRTPGLDKPRDLQRRNRLQESSESTGNSEHAEARDEGSNGEGLHFDCGLGIITRRY
ncbi:uncharacterized protein CC84DRAFT_2788 [Paraphaeosphaeria sporulosa]|uniref:Uncharacterized protein n=1 Tax=Paraphaeosphaeria sporulosa TaxID=1460663 RepID=A0A177CUM5_9PLEO|nr:uncharacterized protein CC84DRAFT_2788 [Paraphaeosphaeria sporulosa]OAG11244.1 hypothetical protein CC84DRAFT_2788 [Paraphaeosphaeria sporulosa]